MVDHSTHHRTDPHADAPEMCASVATADDGTALCTIYPKQAETDAQTAAWVCAEAGSFVSLDDVR